MWRPTRLSWRSATTRRARGSSRCRRRSLRTRTRWPRSRRAFGRSCARASPATRKRRPSWRAPPAGWRGGSPSSTRLDAEHSRVELLPVGGDLPPSIAQLDVSCADQVVEAILELVLEAIARARVCPFGKEVGGLVRAAELERDDVVDLERRTRGLRLEPVRDLDGAFRPGGDRTDARGSKRVRADRALREPRVVRTGRAGAIRIRSELAVVGSRLPPEQHGRPDRDRPRIDDDRREVRPA